MAGFAILADLIGVIAATPWHVSDDLLQQPVAGISTDTRDLEPQQVFLALTGDRFDGHAFVADALERGAIAAIVQTNWMQADQDQANFPNNDLPLLCVEDTLQAYQALGRWWRQQLGATIVAVTGSVGKTTTKELIAAALGQFGRVHKTQANYNNEIGVPKTLLQLDPTHDYAVVEMGMRGAGEIALLTEIAQPEISVITNVGTAHIGRLGSEQAIAEAKCELLAHMPTTGTAILNHDNPRLMATAQGIWTGQQVTYGLEGGDLQGHVVDADTLVVDGVALPLPLPGRHNALNYLAAIAVLKTLQLDWTKLVHGLRIDLPSGRAKRHNLPNDILILDETYNAGVESMTAALQLLADTPGQRRLATLGTMKELGDRSIEFHRQIGDLVRQLQLDGLYVLADPQEAEALAAGADPIETHIFDSHDSLSSHLQHAVQPGDRILFKASRAVALDKVVDQLVQAFNA